LRWLTVLRHLRRLLARGCLRALLLLRRRCISLGRLLELCGFGGEFLGGGIQRLLCLRGHLGILKGSLRGWHFVRGGLRDLGTELLEALSDLAVLQPLFMPTRARYIGARLSGGLGDRLLLAGRLFEQRVLGGWRW
jgi:hypothetical protein